MHIKSLVQYLLYSEYSGHNTIIINFNKKSLNPTSKASVLHYIPLSPFHPTIPQTMHTLFFSIISALLLSLSLSFSLSLSHTHTHTYRERHFLIVAGLIIFKCISRDTWKLPDTYYPCFMNQQIMEVQKIDRFPKGSF
jgi:hypothetical protein